MTQPVIFALTAGEPAGIGPELCLQLALKKRGPGIVVVASKPLLEARARLLGLNVELEDWNNNCSLIVYRLSFTQSIVRSHVECGEVCV